MSVRSLLKPACLTAVLFTASFAAFADQPSDDKAPMGHSPASKEHMMMNNPVTSSGPAAGPAAPSNGMGHSPASKEHTMMNSEAPSSSSDTAAAPSNSMGHSPASKEHTMMKHEASEAPKN